MLENSLIGAYWNRVYDFGERHAFFRYGRIKASSAAKELNIKNINAKGRAPNCEIFPYYYIAYFCNCQNDHHLDAASFLTMFTFSLTLLKSMNNSL